jgi:hypothetical protein
LLNVYWQNFWLVHLEKCCIVGHFSPIVIHGHMLDLSIEILSQKSGLILHQTW